MTSVLVSQFKHFVLKTAANLEARRPGDSVFAPWPPSYLCLTLSWEMNARLLIVFEEWRGQYYSL